MYQPCTNIFYLYELLLKIGCKHPFADNIVHLADSPEASAVEFLARLHLTIVYSHIYIYQFLLTFALELVFHYELWGKTGYSQLLTHFATERISDTLSIIDVPANCSIPFTGLYIFPQRTLLQIDFPCAVEEM